MVVSDTQRIQAAISERGSSDLLTARFRVRIPVPEPTFEYERNRPPDGILHQVQQFCSNLQQLWPMNALDA